MKHIIENESPSRVKAIVTFEKEEWTKAQEKALDKLGAKVNVPGFRPGKAPKNLIRERVKTEDIWNEAVNSLLPEGLTSFMTTGEVRLASQPSVEITKISDEQLEVVYHCVLVPTATLGEYKGLKAKKEAPSVSEEEIQKAIDDLLAQDASLAVVEREAKLGDTILLDFKGYIPNAEGKLEAFEGGEATNFTLELGSHQFIPGFEEGCVGLKAGDKKDLVVTFPENYIKDLAGKEATFKIVIHEVKEKQVPTLDDEAVKDLALKDEGNPIETVDALKEYEKKTILARKVADAENKYFNDILDLIVKNATFVIDEEIIHSEAHSMLDNLKKQIEQQGLSYEQYLEVTGSKEEDLHKTYMENAESNIKHYMAEMEVARAENIRVTDEDVNAEIKKLAERYNMKEEEVRNIIGQNLNNYREQLLETKIREWILANSK